MIEIKKTEENVNYFIDLYTNDLKWLSYNDLIRQIEYYENKCKMINPDGLRINNLTPEDKINIGVCNRLNKFKLKLEQILNEM